ncbi:GNAT family N-acetyltransferase [Dactylosporangium sp. CA-092794]|uniref:GNAT family N-acetyltransferase n=1 Tax=Dactylosporangium sp. CA-092794 TaxID=3239929 RepID=UPI003D935EE7
MSSEPAVLTTPRLTLREMREQDLDDLAALLADPEVMRYYPRPRTRAETADWIELNRRRYREHGFGLWIMHLRAGGAFAGDCGLTVQRVDGVDELELGYHVVPHLQRTGLASEAAAACRDHARIALGARRVIAIIHPDNVASQRVASNAGLTLEKRTSGYASGEQEVLVFSAAL